MIPDLHLPTFETTLPASKKTIKFRPFIVKEERALLVALQSDDEHEMLNAIGQLVSSCTFNVCDIKTLPEPDIEWLWIQLRNRSFGEGMEISATCECGKKTYITINLNEVTVTNPETNPVIKLMDDVWVTMKFPTMETGMGLTKDSPEEDESVVIAKCIENIIIGETIYNEESLEDRTAWVDKLQLSQKEMLKDFFDTMPQVCWSGKFKCSGCDKVNDIAITGLMDFFD